MTRKDYPDEGLNDSFLQRSQLSSQIEMARFLTAGPLSTKNSGQEGANCYKEVWYNTVLGVCFLAKMKERENKLSYGSIV